MQIVNVNKNGEAVPVMVFKNVSKDGKERYSIGISKKIEDGDGKTKYDNTYIRAVFNKNAKIENKDRIYINNAILDFYNLEDKKSIFYIRVFDYTKCEEKQEENDLPF